MRVEGRFSERKVIKTLVAVAIGQAVEHGYTDAFAPYLDDLRRQLRDLRERKDARGDWHRTMVRVFGLVIDGVSIDSAELAENIGERSSTNGSRSRRNPPG